MFNFSYLRSTLTTGVICLFAFVSFLSCDKPNQLENTTWIGKWYFYRVWDESLQVFYHDISGTISIDFSSKEANIEVSLGENPYTNYSSFFAVGKGSYVCTNNKLTLGIEWLLENWIDSQGGVKWEGTLKKNKMILNISGEEVQFNRVY
jgi:hypothetical protein